MFHNRRLTGLRALSASAAVVLVLAGAGPAHAEWQVGASPEAALIPSTWTYNMYDIAGVRYQNPDWRACTGAATEMMLNMIALGPQEDTPPLRGGLPDPSLHWHVDTSYDTQEGILAWERNNMTMIWSAPGTDPHGWRNALNYFGWGSINAGVYRDASYSSYDAAVRAVVSSLARHQRPVGILAWFGGHAQLVTGYKVTGEDPRVGDDYAIVGIYLTDPLEADNMRNTWVSYRDWKTGPGTYRFGQYWALESPYRDPIDGAIGDREWHSKWVIIEPVK